MAKRVIKIILILLALFFIVLLGIWLLGRHTAQKNGTTVLNFRQFLGLGTPVNQSNTTPGTLTSTFTDDNASHGGGLGDTTATDNPQGLSDNTTFNGSDNVQVSQFTSDTFSPDTTTFNSNGSVGSGNLSASGAGLGENQITTGSSGSIGSSASSSSSGNPGGAQCSDADTNISFTADELAQLNTLQNQYNSIASHLATQSDVAQELANHDTYKLEESKIAEMQNFCEATTPLLTDPELKRRVPTPFWHDSNQDSDTFSGTSVASTTTGTGTTSSTGGAGAVLNSSNNPSQAIPFLERVLRINLW